MKILRIICALTLTATSLYAQGESAEKPPLPPGSWPGKLGASAHWVVESKFANPIDPQEAARDPSYLFGNPARAVRAEVTKYGDLAREQSVDELGRSSEIWIQGNRQLALAPGITRPVRVTRAVTEGFRDYFKTPFPELAWLKPSHYTGVQSAGGRTYFVFESDGQKALIDSETRLPAAVITPEETRSYKFLERPTAAPAPPPLFAAEFDAWQKAVERISVNPMRP